MDHVGRDTLSELTAEMAWVRRLARSLLRDDDADDLAHDAMIVAAERPPVDDRPLRPWLARVMINLARMKLRTRKRRSAREQRVAELVEPVTAPEQLVERVELQQLVAARVLALAEPYRSTVLLHFFEELTCAEIARRLFIPEGTVRRRLKVALDELRAAFADRSTGGGLAALVPLAASSTHPATPVALGVLAMKKLIAAAIVLLLLILAGVLWTRRDRHTESVSSTPAPGAHGTMVATTDQAAGGSDAARAADEQRTRWLAQPGVKSRRIAGRVTFRGAPVAGASVELASMASEDGLVSAPRMTTNAAGEFDFGLQAAMRWSVGASAPGKASAHQDLDLRDPRGLPPSDHVEIALGACTAAVFGTLRDASGGPVRGRVALLTNGLHADPAANSDDKGAYELCLETRWPGWVQLDVSADGYAAITYNMIVPGRIHVDFALVPEAVIVGRVVRNDTSAPISGAQVWVPPGPRGTESSPRRGTFSDATGHFRIDRMTAGRHLVFARADGMAESAQGTPAVVGVGQTSVEIELRLESGSIIRGTVSDHGKPVAGANIAALGTGPGGASALSQEDGSFVLANVARGELRFSAYPYEVVSPQTFRVTQAVHDGVAIEVEALGTITGLVLRGKQPVAGANIDIHGPNDQELAPIHADNRGRFEARGLKAGPWTLYGSDDRLGAFGRAPETVQLARGQTVDITIDLAYAGSISGTVVDQNGAPVPGVSVVFRNTSSDDTGITSSAADGTYRAASLTGGGTYRPVVRRTMMSSTVLPPVAGGDFSLVTVDAGDSQVKGVTLAVQLDHLSIAGHVVDSDGAPVPDARIRAEMLEGNRWPLFSRISQAPSDTSTVDGQFAIDDLLAGTYAVRAHSPSGVEATVSGIKAGRTDVTIVLPAPGAIDVTTAGFKTPPQVTATRRDDGPLNAPIIGVAQGTTYALRNLSPGTYVVMGRSAADAATATVEVTAGRTAKATLTSSGSGSVAGHVRDFRTGKPVEGMTCRAVPRIGNDDLELASGDGVHSDAQGAFTISAAPAGPLAIECGGLWRNYSDGLRMITLQGAQRVDIDVPVVALSEEPGIVLGGIGADFDPAVLVPRLTHVQPGGPSAVAGLAEGDIVASVDGRKVDVLSPNGVYILIVNRAPGSKVSVGVTRGATTINAVITLGDARE